MHIYPFRRHFVLLIAALSSLSACVTATVGAITETGISVAEERPVGTKVNDLSIYTELNHLFLQNDTNDVLPNVTINIRHGRVMLTGNVKKEASAALAVKLAWQVKGVREVINEININPKADFFDSANDGLIKKNLETRLLFTKDVWVINYSIDIVSNVAYLLGNVKDEAELQRVLNVTRSTQGVQKVVSHLQVRPNIQQPNPTPTTNTQTTGPRPVEAFYPTEGDADFTSETLDENIPIDVEENIAPPM